jgi:hypothetical protein
VKCIHWVNGAEECPEYDVIGPFTATISRLSRVSVFREQQNMATSSVLTDVEADGPTAFTIPFIFLLSSVKTMCREDTAETNTNVVLADVCTKQWSPAPEIGMAEDPMDTAPPLGVILRSQVEE